MFYKILVRSLLRPADAAACFFGDTLKLKLFSITANRAETWKTFNHRLDYLVIRKAQLHYEAKLPYQRKI